MDPIRIKGKEQQQYNEQQVAKERKGEK